MFSLPLVRYVLLAAARDRLIATCVVLTILGVSLSLFVGGAAIVEKQQFVTVFAAGGLRFLSVIAIALFVAFYMQRSFAQRDVEYLLTRPLTRASFIISHAVAIAVVAFILAALSTLAVAVVSWGAITPAHILLWGASLCAEGLMIGLVALFFAMVLPSATVTALFTFAFYLLARMVGQLLGIIDTHSALWGGDTLGVATKIISTLIPRFDLMTQTSWLVYAPQASEGLLFILAQTLVFSFLVLMASIIDLVRRQF